MESWQVIEIEQKSTNQMLIRRINKFTFSKQIICNLYTKENVSFSKEESKDGMVWRLNVSIVF